jgi:sulfide dehydrogenase cytochrome subunit
MKKETLVAAMEAYKSGERPSTIMGRIAKGYTTEEFNAMGDFFAGQKIVHYGQSFDADKAKAGAKLHDKYCEKCHEKGGRIDDETAILAGQWMPYLTFSMEDYTSGSREMPKKMKKKVDALIEKAGAAGIDDVIHFYASQTSDK